MKVKWIFITILAVFIAGIVLSVLVIKTKVDTDVDIVAVNEIVKTIESHWGHIEQGDYSADQAAICPSWIAVDKCSTKRRIAPSTTINDAIKNRDAIIDVMVKGTSRRQSYYSQ